MFSEGQLARRWGAGLLGRCSPIDTHTPPPPAPTRTRPHRSAQKEFARLEALGEHVLAEEGPDSEQLMAIYDRQVRARTAGCRVGPPRTPAPPAPV